MVKSVINTLSVQGKLHASYKQLQKDAKTGNKLSGNDIHQATKWTHDVGK